MIFTHAICDQTFHVIRLSVGVPLLLENQQVRELVTPVSGYPDPPFSDARLWCREGVLEWQDSRTLEQVKEAKRNQINSWRIAATHAGFYFDGKLVDTDVLSRSDIDGTNGTVTLTGTFPGGWPGYWKARDNSLIPINSLDTWKDFYGAMAAQGTTNFGISQSLKAQLDSATTVQEVDAINWPT